jgi:hypothetical protein
MKPGSIPWLPLHESDETGRPGIVARPGIVGRLGIVGTTGGLRDASGPVGTAASELVAPARPALVSAKPTPIVAVKRFSLNMLSLSPWIVSR